MLDPKFIKENIELVKDGARKKNVEVDIDQWIFLDDTKKKIQQNLDEKRAEQNKISKEIGNAKNEEREKLISGVGNLKKDIQDFEEKLKNILVE
jgi:seryl-tRNA synthetase